MRIVAAGLALVASAASAADWGVVQLFDALAKHRPERAAFSERKFLSLLDRPVESSGELVFTPPERLEKRTFKPRPESVVADRENVTLERAGKRRTLRLRQNPQLAALIESIRGTLAGDLASLTRTYSTALDGTPARWRLILRPLDPSQGAFVERIEIGGTESQVRTVEIFQVDGDRSMMTITPLGK